MGGVTTKGVVEQCKRGGGLIAEGFNGRGKWNRTACVDVRARKHARRRGIGARASQLTLSGLLSIWNLHTSSIVHPSITWK